MLPYLVFAFGVLVVFIGLSFFVSPPKMRNFMQVFMSEQGIIVAACSRVMVGLIMMVAAKDTNFPQFIFWLGFLFLFGGLSLPWLGKDRVLKLFDWALSWSNTVMRIWSLGAIAFGLLVCWGAKLA